MRRFFLRKCLLLMAALAIALPACALDRTAFTFKTTDLQITLDPAQHALYAEGTVEVVNRSKLPQRDIVLQISSTLRWSSVLANGEEVEWLQQFYTTDVDHTGALSEAIVHLPKAVEPGATIKLSVRYSGVVTKDATRLERIGTPATVARRSDWDEIGDRFTALRGIGHVAWYPVAMEAVSLEQGNELFDALRNWREERSGLLKVALSRTPLPGDDPAPYLIVTTDEASKPGPVVKAEFRGTDPVVVLLHDAESTTDRPRVAAYYTKSNQIHARDYMAATESVIPALEEWFGTPRTRIMLVELTDPNALPYDVGSIYFAPMRSVVAAGAEVALARPVAHSMIESPRPWIREGLTGFAQAIVREHQAGRRDAIAYLAEFSPALIVAEAQASGATAKESAKPDETPLATTGPQPLVTTNDEIFFRSKAAYVWWMLRDMIGDQPLQLALARYRAEDDRDTGYMQRVLEAQLPKGTSLETFFDDWVYRDKGLPQLKVDSAYVRQTLNGQTVTAVTIHNLGDAWCQVPVAVRGTGGETNVRVVVPAHGKAVVRIPFEKTPTEAEVNDGSVPESEPRDNIVQISAAPAEAVKP